jgi:hypothetical protein
LIFFQFFPFPSGGGMAIFFQNLKQTFLIQISKTIFSRCFHFKFSLWHKCFFLDPRLPNLLIDCKNYIVTLIKNNHILYTTTWWYDPP